MDAFEKLVFEIKGLSEERRNPEFNPKISSYEQLKPYSNDRSFFITFTEIEKLGINPSSRFTTPIGIYTYPLKEVWSKYDIDEKRSLKKSLPFAGGRPYVWLLKSREDQTAIKDIDSYSQSLLEKDENVLKKYILSHKDEFSIDGVSESVLDSLFSKWKEEAKEMESLWNGPHAKMIPFIYLWNITQNISKVKKGRPNVQWNYILYRILGYKGFVDNGKGHIHYRQPAQAVFLTTRAFTVVDKILNKDYENLTKKN